MIKNYSKTNGDEYGVGHNASYIVVCVCGQRVALTPSEAKDFAKDLAFHIQEQEQGLWHGERIEG
jgi:hypothetical protein